MAWWPWVEGGSWIYARYCRLGPTYCRCWCPGEAGEVVAAASRRNKVLRAFLHLDGVCSGAIDGLVRSGCSRSEASVQALDVVRPFGVSGGVSLLRQEEATHRYGGVAEVCVALRRGDLVSCSGSHRWTQIPGQGGTGRGPSRRTTSVSSIPSFGAGDFCGSEQSYGAMVLSLVLVCSRLFLVSSGVSFDDGGWRRRCTVMTARTKTLEDLLVNYNVSRVFCAVWQGQLSPRYPPCTRVFVYVSTVYVVLIF